MELRVPVSRIAWGGVDLGPSIGCAGMNQPAITFEVPPNPSYVGTSKLQLGGTVLFETSPIFKSSLVADTAGEVIERRELANVRLRESIYPRGLRLERHSHANSFLSFVVEGHYTETYQGGTAVCVPGALRFLPAGEVHSNAYEDGARCLLVELQASTLERLREYAHVLENPGEIVSERSAMLTRRLYAEFRQHDTAAALAIEGLVLELLAESVRSAAGATRRAPRWLLRARDLIQARFLEVPSLAEIARECGVHPVHLSREFRRYFDSTVGEYMRKLRIEHASHLLAATPTPLAEIANVCGFADQSHFSSTFKRVVGLTPARFRETHS